MTNKELGHRATACKRFEWMPGMQILDALGEPYRIKWVNGDSLECDDDDCLRRPYDGITPDLEDPATLGCLLHLVREAWGDDHVVVLGGLNNVSIYPREQAHEAWLEGDLCCPVWDSSGIYGEVESLVAALEAAP